MRPGTHSLLRRLRDNERVLHAARAEAAGDADAKEPLTPDAEWLLDNFFVIEEVLREVRKDLPRGYYDELPVVTVGPWAGLPRIYALAVALITHTDSHLDDAAILRFVQAFQEVAPLTIGELWAVPTMLRLALLENLRRLGGPDARGPGRAAARGRPGSAGPSARRSRRRCPTADRRLPRRLAQGPPRPRERHPGRPARATGSPDTRTTCPRSSAASTGGRPPTRCRSATASPACGCCNAIDWAVFFEKASLVEAVLRAEPTGVYPRQEFATRDRYRQAVEQLAKAAEARRGRGRPSWPSPGPTAGDRPRRARRLLPGRRGPQAFARELGCRFKFRDRWRTFLTDHPHAVYFGGAGRASPRRSSRLAVALAWAGGRRGRPCSSRWRCCCRRARWRSGW